MPCIGSASCSTSSARTPAPSSGWTRPSPSSARSATNGPSPGSSTASGVVRRNIGDLDAAEPLLTESLDATARPGRHGRRCDRADEPRNPGNRSARARPGHRSARGGARDRPQAWARRSGSAYSSSALGTALLRVGRRDEALVLLAIGPRRVPRAGGWRRHRREASRGSAKRRRRATPAVPSACCSRRSRSAIARGSACAGSTRTPCAMLLASVSQGLSADQLAAARADAGGMDADAAVAFALADPRP